MRLEDILSIEEIDRLKQGKFGQKMGFGNKPALVVIDAQNYMFGSPEGPNELFPSSCGLTAHQALEPMKKLLNVARRQGVPVVYTKFILRRDGRDIGVYGRKRELLKIEGWCLEDTFGAAISTEIEPTVNDFVFVKKKPSAFFGTPLLPLLIERQIDTVVIMGGSTSNCVRATSVDSMSYNFRTIVVEDCVFDRVEISHYVALFDLQRQYADVVNSREVMSYFERLYFEFG